MGRKAVLSRKLWQENMTNGRCFENRTLLCVVPSICRTCNTGSTKIALLQPAALKTTICIRWRLCSAARNSNQRKNSFFSKGLHGSSFCLHVLLSFLRGFHPMTASWLRDGCTISLPLPIFRKGGYEEENNKRKEAP